MMKIPTSFLIGTVLENPTKGAELMILGFMEVPFILIAFMIAI